MTAYLHVRFRNMLVHLKSIKIYCLVCKLGGLMRNRTYVYINLKGLQGNRRNSTKSNNFWILNNLKTNVYGKNVVKRLINEKSLN